MFGSVILSLLFLSESIIHLFDEKYSKNSNLVKNYYILNELFSV